jgi:membrane fusion protein (multidrug efflux system)
VSSEGEPLRARISWRKRLGKRGLRTIPMLVWCAALLCIAVLWHERRIHAPLKGLAEPGSFEIAAPREARVTQVAVVEGQRVEAGAVLAELDAAAITEQLAAARHEFLALEAELASETELLQSQRTLEQLELDVSRGRETQRFARDVEDSRLELMQTTAELAEARVSVRGLRDEYDRVRGLAGSGVASELEIVKVTTQHDALAKRIAELESIETARGARVAAAEERLKSFHSAAEARLGSIERQLQPLRWRIRAQESVVAELELQRAACVVRAPGAGVVQGLLRRAGEFVREGDSLCRIVEPVTRNLVAYVPEELYRSLDPTQPVRVERADHPGSLRPARIRSISPAVVSVPVQLRADPRVEEWAIALHVEPHGDELPGQSLRIYLTPR